MDTLVSTTPLPAAPHQAWFDLHDDAHITTHPTALRVYARLLHQYGRPDPTAPPDRPPVTMFTHPVSVKAWAVAHTLRVTEESVGQALALLIAHGYLRDHGRGQHNVRRLTLVERRAEARPIPTRPDRLADHPRASLPSHPHASGSGRGTRRRML